MFRITDCNLLQKAMPGQMQKIGLGTPV